MRWVRRRVRQYLWKQWKTGRNRKQRLRQLTIEEWKMESNSYRKMAGSMSFVLNNSTVHTHFNLVDAMDSYEKLHANRKQDGIVLEWQNLSRFG